MRFGQFARDRRLGRRVSLRDLARHLGWSAAYVSDIERGQRNPPEEAKVRQWARFLDEDESSWVEIAANDTEAVVVPVDRHPKKTQLARLVARRISHMTEEQIDEAMAYFEGNRDG